jgi:hypothetical protein
MLSELGIATPLPCTHTPTSTAADGACSGLYVERTVSFNSAIINAELGISFCVVYSTVHNERNQEPVANALLNDDWSIELLVGSALIFHRHSVNFQTLSLSEEPPRSILH